MHVCVNGTCIHTYWPGFVGFHEMWYFLHGNQHFLWKAHEKQKNSRLKTHLSHFDLVFHRVWRKGQLDISYILVVFGGVCGACMCKWCMYTHISTWFCFFHERWHSLYEKWCFSWKVHEKDWKAPDKQQKHPIQHRSLILTWSFIEYRGKAN